MKFNNFTNQTVTHKITKMEEKTKTSLAQTVTMTAPIENGELIKVINQRDSSLVASIEQINDKYFLNLSGAILKNAFGQELPLADKKIEIIENSKKAPVLLGSGLDDELIISISFGDGQVGQAKVTPTSIELDYNGQVFSLSTLDDNYCLDLNISANVVESMFMNSGAGSDIFRTPTIFGKGKGPFYLLGMYASQIDDNLPIKLGDISVFKIKTSKMDQSIMFFGQKDKLFIYNNGKLERTISHHFTHDEHGNVSLAFERVGDTSYLKIPLGINLNTSPSLVLGDDPILKLFDGYSCPLKQGDKPSNANFTLQETIKPVAEDPRKWTNYVFRYKPLSQKVTREAVKSILFYETKFLGDDAIYYINQNLQRIFTIDDGKIVWHNFNDFSRKLEGNCSFNGHIEIQNIDNQIIFINQTDKIYKLISNDNSVSELSSNDYAKIAHIEILDEAKVAPVSTNQTDSEITEASTSQNEADVAPLSATDADTQTNDETTEASLSHGNETYVINLADRTISCNERPEESIDFNKFIYSMRDETELAQAIESWNSQVPQSQRIDLAEIIRSEQLAEQKATKKQGEQTQVSEKTEEQAEPSSPAKPELTAPTPKKKPEERSVDHKKRAENFSTVAMSLGILASLIGGVLMMPMLVLVGLIATIGGGVVNTFSDFFKYTAFDSVRKKIKSAEDQQRNNGTYERENFIARDHDYDMAEMSATIAEENLRELCLSTIGETDKTASQFKMLLDEYGISYPNFNDPNAIMDFEHLANGANLGTLSYRSRLVEQMDVITKTTDYEERTQLIDDFFSTNFNNIPQEKREQFATMFDDTTSMMSLMGALSNLNASQQKLQDIATQQRRTLTDSSHGADRIVAIATSLKGEEQIKFFERYGEVIAHALSTNPEKISVVTNNILENVEPQYKTQVLSSLTLGQQKLTFSIDDAITLSAQTHIASIDSISTAQTYAELMSTSEEIVREHVSTQDMLRAYTHGVYHEALSSDNGGNLYGFVHAINEDALEENERLLLSSVKTALTSPKLEEAFKVADIAIRNDSIEESIDSMANTGMIETLLPKASESHFNPSKSIFNLARKIAQSEIDTFNNDYLIKKKNRTKKEYVVSKTSPYLKLANSSQLLTSKETSERVIESVKHIDELTVQEMERNLPILLEIVEEITKLGDEEISTEDISATISRLKSFALSNNLTPEQLTKVAKSKLIAEMHHERLASTITKNNEEEAVIGERASLYMNLSEFIDLSLDDKLSQVRIASSYSNATNSEHGVISSTPADVCGVNEQERQFNGKFEAFLATLSPEQQSKIKTELSTRTNSTVQDKLEAILVVVGNQFVGQSGLTYKEFISKHLSEGHMDLDLANIDIEHMRDCESTKIHTQMMTLEDKFNGVESLSDVNLRDLLRVECAKITGEYETYDDIVDWIVKTQGISREEILVTIEKITSESESITNKELCTTLFNMLKINNKEVLEKFNADQSKIKNLKLKNLITTFDRQQTQDYISLINTKVRINFKKQFDAISKRILNKGLTRDSYIELSTLLNAQENHVIVAELGFYPEILEGALTNAKVADEIVIKIKDFVNGEVYKQFAQDVSRKEDFVSAKLIKRWETLSTKREFILNNLVTYNSCANQFLAIIEKQESIDHATMISVIEFLKNPKNEVFARDTFGEECFAMLKSLIVVDENVEKIFNDLIEKLDTNPENHSTLNEQLRARVETVLSTKAENVAKIDTIISEDEQTKDETYELLELRTQKAHYAQKFAEFNNLYSQFLQNPSLSITQSAILTFVHKLDNQEFLTLSGFTPSIIENIVDKCRRSPNEALKIANFFEKQVRLSEASQRVEVRFAEQEKYLRALQIATSQDEIDLIEKSRNLDRIKVFDSQVTAISSLNEEQQADTINDLFKYYSLVGKLNILSSLCNENPTEELADEIQTVEAKIEELRETSLLASNLSLEDSRMFAGQMFLSSEYFEEMIENDVPPIAPLLTGDAKKKALEKRKKLLAKRATRLQKKFKSFKRSIADRQETERKNVLKAKRKLETSANAKPKTPEQSKRGLSVFGKILGHISRSNNATAIKPKIETSLATKTTTNTNEVSNETEVVRE